MVAYGVYVLLHRAGAYACCRASQSLSSRTNAGAVAGANAVAHLISGFIESVASIIDCGSAIIITAAASDVLVRRGVNVLVTTLTSARSVSQGEGSEISFASASKSSF